MNALSTTAAALTTALAAATELATAAAAASPAIAYTVKRVFIPPDYETYATSDMQILVIGFDEDVDLNGNNGTRNETEHEYGVKVAIVKQITAGDVTSDAAVAELDGISDFRETVIDYLKKNRTQGSAKLSKLKNSPATYDPATLAQKKTYVSVLELNYRLLR